MTGTITISLDEYEKLKALEGKRVYTGSLSDNEIDRLSKLRDEYVIFREAWDGIGPLFYIHGTQKEAFLRYESEISKLRNRNLWGRITRKYE